MTEHFLAPCEHATDDLGGEACPMHARRVCDGTHQLSAIGVQNVDLQVTANTRGSTGPRRDVLPDFSN